MRGATAVVTPVRSAEADSIWELLSSSSRETVGMTAIPGSAAEAQDLCGHSEETLAQLATGSFQLEAGQYRRVLFLAKDTRSGTPLGISGVTFKKDVPDLSVRVGTSADGLGLVMRSSSELWTRTELNSSFLGFVARGQRIGTLLSRGRLVFLHLVRSQIPPTIASHLRGRVDSQGHAPFWDHFGAAFAPQWTTSTAAELALLEDPTRLDQMANRVLPLTASVLESLGPVNAASLPAFHLLLREGLEPNGRYDPIDGGPTLMGSIDSLQTKVNHHHGPAEIVDLSGKKGEGTTGTDALIAVASVPDFRVTRGPVRVGPTSLGIQSGTAKALGVKSGTLLAVSTLEH